MRVLVLILVLANLAVFAWLRWAQTVSRGPDAKLVAPPTGGVELKLLPPGATLAKPAKRASRAARPRCLVADPATSATAARALAASLARSGFSSRLDKRSAIVTDSYQVLLSGFSDGGKAVAAAAGLRRSGIHDVQVIAAPGQGAVISVGVFRSGADARRRVVQLRKMGLSPQVQEHTRAVTQWYLELPGSASAEAAVRAAGSAAASIPAPCPASGPLPLPAPGGASAVGTAGGGAGGEP